MPEPARIPAEALGRMFGPAQGEPQPQPKGLPWLATLIGNYLRNNLMGGQQPFASNPANMQFSQDIGKDVGLMDWLSKSVMAPKLNWTMSEVQDVFHGSPYRFDKFLSSKIGTGEGAQAFGWGHYVSESPKVGRNYQSMALNPDRLRKTYGNAWDAAYHYNKGNTEAALASLDNQISSIESGIAKYGVLGKEKEALSKYKGLRERIVSGTEPRAGALYKVTLHKGKDPSEYTWLDWDKSPSPEAVNKLVDYAKGIWKENPDKKIFDHYSDEIGQLRARLKGGRGQGIYKTLSREFGSDKAASDFLLKNGIDGIRYPAGSLSGVKSKAKNYVVFDENAITIEDVM